MNEKTTNRKGTAGIVALGALGLLWLGHAAFRDASIDENVEKGEIRISGRISAFTAFSVERKLKNAEGRPISLIIDGPGGEVPAAFAISDAIERHGTIRTIVPEDEICASACAIIWSSGKIRELRPEAALLIHGASSPKPDPEGIEAIDARQRAMLAKEPDILRMALDRNAYEFRENDGILIIRRDDGLVALTFRNGTLSP
jgi:hypothetical protein